MISMKGNYYESMWFLYSLHCFLPLLFFLISITGIIIRYLLRFCMYYVREEIVRIEPFLRVSAERASHILLGKEEKRPDNSTNNNSY